MQKTENANMPIYTNMPIDNLLTELMVRLKNVNDVHRVCIATCEVLAAWFNLPAVVLIRSQEQPYYFNAWLGQPKNSTMQMHLRRDEKIASYLTEPSLFTVDAPDIPFSATENDDLIGAPFDWKSTDMPLVGAICLLVKDESSSVTSLLPMIASHVTSYIERAYFHQVITQQRILFNVVNNITASLTSTLSLQDIYERVANPVRRSLNVESVSIGLVDKENHQLVFVPELFEQGYTLRVELGEGIAGWVVENEKTVMTNNPYADERFLRDVDDDTGFETRSIVAVPLKHNGRVIGVLEGINKLSGGFSHFDRQLVESISGPLAVAIENANLHADVLSEKRRVETILSSMSEGLLTFDATGIITGINEALLSMLQLASRPADAHSIFDLVKIDEDGRLSQFIETVLETSEEAVSPQMSCNLQTYYAEESMPVLISGVAIRDLNGEVSEAVLAFSDLRQVREVERMRDDFFNNIVHELRTPLATILMYARLLDKEVSNGATETNKRYIKTIASESDRLQIMVRSMLALARLEAKEIQRSDRPIDINSIFDDVIPSLTQHALEKGVVINTKIMPVLPFVHGDRDVLYSAIKNLLDNAVKFTLKGEVTIIADRKDNTLLIDVIDTGIGIPAQAIPSLFKRFFRSSTAVEHGIAGTGLGLYMVKEGIERHQGTISVESIIYQGTTFRVTLPIHDG